MGGRRVRGDRRDVAPALLVLLFFPWNTLREPIANYYSAKTGRQVVIAGDLTVKLAWHPWIDVRGIAIANAPWSDQPVMASVERLGMRVEPLSYFTRLRIPEIELQAPRAIFELNADGVGNWVMGDSVIGGDTTDSATSAVRTAERVGCARALPRSGSAGATRRVRDRAHGGGPAGSGKPDLLRGRQSAGRTLHHRRARRRAGHAARARRAVLPGVLGQGRRHPGVVRRRGRADFPDKLRGFIKIAGQDMSQLYPLLPAPVPWTPPTRSKATWFGSRSLEGHGLSGKVGRSDVSGVAEILTDTPRRKFVADIVSTRLDYRDLGGFVGLPAGASAAARSPEQKAEAAKLARQERVFSDDRFELDRLRDYDAHFRFRGKAVRVDDVPMEIVEMNIHLDRGVLRYDPVKVGIADGTVTLVGSIDANSKAPRLDMRLEGRNLDLARIYPSWRRPAARRVASADSSR
jgi:uncharacterized protein involved in outer membrane biogenesis